MAAHRSTKKRPESVFTFPSSRYKTRPVDGGPDPDEAERLKQAWLRDHEPTRCEPAWSCYGYPPIVKA